MTTLAYLHHHAIPSALGLLPPAMTSQNATALLLAIALQESNANMRRQLGGSARGFWQFEVAGLIGVCTHAASAPHLEQALVTLCYRANFSSVKARRATAKMVQTLVTDNDVLACLCARLLLWTDSAPLPGIDGPQAAWELYLRTWRPGRPHGDLWEVNFLTAWKQVQGDA